MKNNREKREENNYLFNAFFPEYRYNLVVSPYNPMQKGQIPRERLKTNDLHDAAKHEVCPYTGTQGTSASKTASNGHQKCLDWSRGHFQKPKSEKNDT